MTNWQLIITLATLVFAIFGAGWLNLQMFKSYVDSRFDGIKSSSDARFDGIKSSSDARFDAVRAEFATLRAEMQAGHNELRGDIAAHRIETKQMAENVERLSRQMEALYRPVLPGNLK